MTRPERDCIVQDMLGRYGHRVGKTVVEDDMCLGRLLGTLRFDLEDDRQVGNYLCSFLGRLGPYGRDAAGWAYQNTR
jgi:hypothetical protein